MEAAGLCPLVEVAASTAAGAILNRNLAERSCVDLLPILEKYDKEASHSNLIVVVHPDYIQLKFWLEANSAPQILMKILASDRRWVHTNAQYSSNFQG